MTALEEQMFLLQQQINALKSQATGESTERKETTPDSTGLTRPKPFTCGEVESECKATQQEVSDLDIRLEEVERIAGKIHHSGWFDVSFRDNNKPKNKHYFDADHLYLNFDSRIDRVWRAFMEIELEHSPSVSDAGTKGDILLDRGYLERKLSGNDRLRFGKFFTPLGYWVPEHWAINVETIQKPIHADNKYVPENPVGVLYSGTLNQGNQRPSNLDFSLYLVNGSEVSGTNKPTDNKLGGGSDLRYRFGDQRQNKLGFSYYRQNNPAKLGRLEVNHLSYADYFPHRKLLLRIENMHQNRNNRFDDVYVFYASAKYQISRKTYINFRWNKGDDDKNGKGVDQTVQTLTIGWWLKPYVRTKFEFSKHRFQDPTIEAFNQWAASLGVLF